MPNIEQAKEASDVINRPIINTPFFTSRYQPRTEWPRTVQDAVDRPALRVVAVAAPDSAQGKKDEGALNSSDPASLYNACRIAASRARSAQGGWANSNWADCSRAKVRENFLLLYSLDDLPAFVDVLRREQPNVLLLGAMTLCMPGAIECAKLAKEMFGNDIIVVLGGRHVTETIYIKSGGARLTRDITHHRASPARLVREGHIPPVFDIMVSGDGEFVIAELGEIIAQQSLPYDMGSISEAVDCAVPGDWIISFPSCSRELVSAGVPINSDALPPLAGLFGISTAFDVFGGRMTAHVFSDTGRGCAYDCAFCSEKSGVTGGLRHLATAADRLYRQFEDVVAVIEEDYPGTGASAFVEDSILLGGSPRALDQLSDLLECRPLPIQFGAQFTVDQILNRERQIARLSGVGLRYIFIGLETFDPKEIGGMSKDIGSKNGSWQDRATRVFQILTNHRINCGCALLFGLGESHDSRIALLDTLIASRQKTGCPTVISANWAVQHPLRGQSGGSDFDYLSWGTPPGPYLDLFHHFGEASVNYPLEGQRPPEIRQIEEIVDRLKIFAACKNQSISAGHPISCDVSF